ncbi:MULTISPECIES: hypothetical protein [Clostridium]|uniref:hypothetical protein n=1 Tax=Clostridium TaxID=1485 RepID=UPI000CA69B90|nr:MULTISPECIES: hypothetical protein [Clostridium]PJI07918.1 hypothetical protein CUB90_08575 [Clostridium sp. CT7]
MKKNVIYVDFSRRCRKRNHLNLIYNILNILKSAFKFNKSNTNPKNDGGNFDNRNRRIL